MTNEQSKNYFLNNQNLFSKNYLEYRLPAISIWKDQKEKAEKVFKEIKAVYEKTKNLKLGSGQEAELEDKFIRPVLSALGFVYNVQPVTKRGFKKRRPDYALFKDTGSHKEASKYKDDPNKFFSKSLLYKSGVEYADFCINHVEGCSHGCRYPCYAMLMKKRCGVIKSYDEWRKPKIVSNALELLDKEIPRYKKKIKYVHLCFSTDPFMYGKKRVCELSLKIINKLNLHNIRCTVLTKGVYPQEIAKKNGFSKKNEYGITLVSLNDVFKKKYEPHTANVLDRIESLKFLSRKGFKTWVSIEPYPTPNIIDQDLTEILESVSFVDKIIFGRLNYSVKTTDFKHKKEFYNSLAKSVIKFCKRNKIKHYIKQGTQISKS